MSVSDHNQQRTYSDIFFLWLRWYRVVVIYVHPALTQFHMLPSENPSTHLFCSHLYLLITFLFSLKDVSVKYHLRVSTNHPSHDDVMTPPWPWTGTPSPHRLVYIYGIIDKLMWLAAKCLHQHQHSPCPDWKWMEWKRKRRLTKM